VKKKEIASIGGTLKMTYPRLALKREWAGGIEKNNIQGGLTTDFGERGKHSEDVGILRF